MFEIVYARWVSLVLTCFVTAAVAADRDDVDVICKNGALYSMKLVPAEFGTSGVHQAEHVTLGPAKRVWLDLPDGTVARSPIPVPNINASPVEIPLTYPDGSQKLVSVAVSERAADGLTEAQLIRARIDVTSYQLPQGCRVLAGRETRSYADAMLNNAGCLLPPEAHERLASLPDAPRALARDCGWDADLRGAERALEKAADLGSIEAGWVLSQLYLGNVHPEVQRLDRAYVRLNRAGGIGHNLAELTAGIMQWEGVGTARDAKAAFTALLPYARRGSKEAQGIIGTMYLTGEGAPENNVHAYAWCSLAAGAEVRHSDPRACVEAAREKMYAGQLEAAVDLAVEIHNGWY